MCEKSLIKSVKFISTVALLLLFNGSIMAQVQANFTADTTSGCGGLTVTFTNTSNVSGPTYNYAWNFGNGNSSTLENPSATYSTPGSYDVQLIVSNSSGTNRDTIIKANLITIYSRPNADFSFTPSGGCSPLTVNFTNTTTIGDAPIVTNKWVFADGSQPFLGNNATHNYQTAGNYQPSLEVIDQNGCRDLAVDDTVFVTQSPQARITTLNNRISCQAPYTVNFKSNSSGFNLTYKWFFGDGDSSQLENPSHTYNALGLYDVTLIVSDPNCSDTLFISEYVILENSVADFSLPKDTLCLGETFSPTNNSQGSSIFSWNFGDGNQKNGKDISHTYQDSGYFEITLAVSAGAACTDTYTDSIYVQMVTADFVTSPNYICEFSDDFKFTYTGVNADSFLWKIDTGGVFPIEFYTDSFTYNQGFNNGEDDTLLRGHQLILFDTLIARSNAGCVDTVAIDTNRIIEPINVKISLNGAIIPMNMDTVTGRCLPIDVQYTDSTSGPGDINQWRWVFDRTDTFNVKSPPPRNYPIDSAYSVELTVWNNLGCSATDSFAFLGGFKQSPKITFLQDSFCHNEEIIFLDESTDTSKITLTEYTLILSGQGSITTQPIYFGRRGDTVFTSQHPMVGYHFLNVLVSHNGCDTILATTDSIYLSQPFGELAAFDMNCDSNNVLNPTFQFVGNAYGSTGFYWDFGDSSALDSTTLYPTHTYTTDTSTVMVKFTTYDSLSGCPPHVDSLELDLRPYPGHEITPVDSVFCINDTVLFVNQTSGNVYASIFWVLNGDTIGIRNNFIEIIFTQYGNNTVELHTIDLRGCTTITQRNIFIPEIKADFGHEFLTTCVPVEVAFRDSSISDDSISSWRWTFDNGDTSRQANDTVTYLYPGKRDVFLWVEDINGCADSILKKDYISTSIFSVEFSQSQVVICAGDSVVFRNRSSGNNIDYTWIFGNDTIQSNDIEVNHTFTQAGTYDITLIAKNQIGCTLSEVKTEALVVGANPTADFVADTLQSPCYPLDVNFTDLSTGNPSQWNWRFGDGNSSAIQNPFNSYTSLGTFDVFLKVSNDAGCEDSTLKVDYIQTNGPDADIQLSKDTACIHENITFSLINQQNVDYFEWDFGDGTISKDAIATHAFRRTGTVYFTLSLFDSLGFCQAIIRDSVHIFKISATFTVDEDTACQPHRALFTATSPGASQLTWDFGNGNTSNNPTTTHTYQNSGLFTAELVVNSALGCKDTTEQLILVHPKPQATSHNDTTICYGDTIQLWAKGGTAYHWNNEQFLSDDSSSTTRAWPDSSTTFMVEVFNAFNCIDTAYTTVHVQPPPLNNPLNYTDTSLIIGEFIDLDATAGDSLIYSWRPKEGLSCTNCASPRAQPMVNSRYIVTISDPFGCFSFNDTIFIQVIEKYSLEVPNAFSPNGDGNNDIIYAKGWGLKDLIAFKIYNRFGELVFESTEFDHGWDGTYKGKPQNMETYVYTVEAETYSGKVLSKKGNISLLR